MDFKRLLGCVCSTLIVIQLIGIDVMYAETLHIDILNTTCDQTFDMATYERIKFSYEEETITNVDVYSSPPRCIFTIVNNDVNMEICITGWGSTAPHWGEAGCDSTFRFYIGYLPSSGYLSGGYHCNSFRREPMCTRRSNMYAVFQDNLMFFEDIVKIDIYRQSIHVPTTTTRRTPTRNWSSNIDNNENRDPRGTTNISIVVIIVAIVMFVMACVCCVIYRYNRKRDIPEQLSQQPVTEPVDQASRQVSYTADAPSYSSVMQQQQQQHRLLHDEVTNNIQIHDPVHPSAPPIDSLPEHEQSYNDQPVINPIPDHQPINQTIPTTPPPSYYDVEPPPYPGNWSST